MRLLRNLILSLQSQMLGFIAVSLGCEWFHWQAADLIRDRPYLLIIFGLITFITLCFDDDGRTNGLGAIEDLKPK